MDKEKPFPVRMNETIGTIQETVNASGLPACVLRYIFRDFSNQLEKLTEQELGSAVAQMTEQESEENEEAESE